MMSLFELPTDNKKAFPWKLVVIFIIFTIALILAGLIYYNSQRNRIIIEHQNSLAAVVSLKIDQIVAWRNERLGDAAVIMNNEPVIRSIKQYFEQKNESPVKRELSKWMRSFIDEYDYCAVFLIDTTFKTRLSVAHGDTVVSEAIREDLEDIKRNPRIMMTEIYKVKSAGYVHIDLLVPLMDPENIKSHLVCYLILRIDPYKKLFPLVQSWPTPSKSSETLLVRKDGDSVVYLNELRFQKNTVLNLKLPVDKDGLLATSAIRGVKGIVRGVDYRNVPVVGYIAGIPGLSWYMVAKVDREEIQVPTKRYLYISGVLITLLILINGFIFGSWLWNQKLMFYKQQLQFELGRKQTEEEIRRLNEELELRVIRRTEQLEASNKELEAFSYSVSHDLRSPLRSVHGYTNILLEEYDKVLDDEGKRICRIISSSAIQMGELIDDLLNFSRIGRSSLNIELLNMKLMATTVFAELSNGNEKVQNNLIIGDLHEAYGDAKLIKLVWNNLISNAIKYSSEVNIPEIRIVSTRRGDFIVYSVKDNGVGFDMLYKQKLFGVFQRLHSEREFEGNGVGLAIVKRIILMHSGQVWAEGEVGKGAAFHFSLPAEMEDKGDASDFGRHSRLRPTKSAGSASAGSAGK